VTWERARDGFRAAAGWFVATAGQVERWDEPGLGEWDVRALVGHTSRSFVTVEEYLARPAGAVEVASAADYYRAISAMAVGPAVVERGRAAGAALGADPAAAVGALADRVVPLVDARTGDELLTTLAGGMRLVDYLPTRTFELVVHTVDLTAALGAPADPPPAAARAALALATDLAVLGGHAAALLRAATGRPTGPFTVL
jgi:hypothetical protein